MNSGFESIINVEEDRCCDGKDKKVLVKKCGCEEVGEACGCRLEKDKFLEKKQQIIFFEYGSTFAVLYYEEFICS